ncbi:complement C1q and tumor necrosis factor-related protein 9 [Gadus macrocephalus]|uniref:complement C1q and tumor necrosis factor-related protein 9 n=1 Tax=Gadus macrocephalus TaxID=80720 RepID=UPI0028CBB966|nr:complement C1q and tumor necrosis factor-related protein 9 [Gadus macrocephalus]
MLYPQVAPNSPEDQTPGHTMSTFAVLMHLVFFSLTTAMPDPSTPAPFPPDNDQFPPFPPENDQFPPFPLPPGMEDLGGKSFEGGMGQNVSLPGEQTEAYCQMLLDSPVPLPADQVPWFCICFHCQGRHGPKGDPGERGLSGSPGSAGRRGLTGVSGPPGYTGRQGIKGQKGDEGLKGDGGPEGPLGPKGQRGYKGDKGEAGLEGRTGQPGGKGDDGVCPETCAPVEGPAGGPGLPGSTGPRGLPGTGGKGGDGGPKGDQGDLGPQGAPGEPGRRGEAGPQGDCSCDDGAAGPPGESGQKGEGGADGPSGPRGGTGEPGAKGDLGEMGVRGVPGPCMPAIQSSFAMGLAVSFPPPDAPVAFTRVLDNRQGHYDPLGGIYTAPVNGTYVFSYALTVYSRILKVGLFHNYVPQVKTTHPALLGTASHQLVLNLVQGDGVWLQVRDQMTNGMYASSETSSTFSGYLLHPDTCYMPELRQPLYPAVAVTRGPYEWGTLPGGPGPNATISSEPTEVTPVE